MSARLDHLGRPLTALARLLEDLRAGNTLPWAMEYAPDGDADRAVYDAWCSDNGTFGLALLMERGFDWDYYRGNVLPVLRSRPPATKRTRYAHDGKCLCLGGVALAPWEQCKPCADHIRRMISCPTWAELHGEKRS